VDEAAGRKWRTTSAVGAPLLAGADTAGGGGPASSPLLAPAAAAAAQEEHKSPLQYYYTYKKRGMYALGIVRAVRNIAAAHASDYVADGAFASVDDVHAYFLDAFPWLVVDIRDAWPSV
jgi:hypothetical protein